MPNLSTVEMTVCVCDPIKRADSLRMEIGSRLTAQDLELDLVVDDDTDIQATEGIRLAKNELYIQDLLLSYVDEDKKEQVEEIARQAVEESAAALGLEVRD